MSNPAQSVDSATGLCERGVVTGRWPTRRRSTAGLVVLTLALIGCSDSDPARVSSEAETGVDSAATATTVAPVDEPTDPALTSTSVPDEPEAEPTATTTTTPTPTSTAPPADPEPGDDASPDAAGTPLGLTALEVDCDDIGRCTQYAEAPSGALIALSLNAPELVRAADPSDTEPTVIPVDRLGTDGWLITVGPDDVAYVAVAPSSGAEIVLDVIAIPTVGPRAGEVVAAWPEATDSTGDSELVATADGLVIVSCCGSRGLLPDPAAEPVVTWVDESGGATTSPGPFVTTRTGDGGNDIELTSGDETAVFPLPVFAQGIRGMPTTVALDDGGLAATMFDNLTGAFVTAVYGPPGPRAWSFTSASRLIVRSVGLGDGTIAEGPRVLTILRSGEALVEVNGEVRLTTVDALGDEGWPGQARVDDWTISADGFNEFIEFAGPDWATNPWVFGAMLHTDWWPNERTVIEADGDTIGFGEPDGLWVGATAEIVITTTGFLDDSVFGSRWTVTVEVAPDGRLRFVDGRVAQVCQPGRGHQDYRPELCI